jgi:membrane peptidoglycan carboxypeptidase
MREQNMIDNKAYIENIAYTYKPLAQITKKDINSPFISTLIHEAANILNISEKEIIRSGYRISTYYDDKIQHAMFKAFESEEFAPKNQNGMCPDYSALMLDNATGGVCAYYASYDLSPLNMKRQPGSAIKPILVYAPAFEKNHITPASVYNDKRTQFGDYKPKNYMDDYKGEIPIRDAIKNSSNVIAVSLLNEIGIDYAKEYAQRMGINFSANDNYLSLALGGMTDGCTPLELGGAYMTLANGGKHTKPTFIREIRDKYGNILYKHTPYFTQAISKQTAFLLTDILKDTAKNGTAKKLKNLEFDVAAKTGTVGATNSFNNDAWNLSYTRENTLCVWYGNINYEKEKAFNLTGGTYPTMFAKYIYQNIAQKPASFTPPDGIVRIKIDTLALRELRKAMQASDNTPQKYYKYEYFNIKNAPIEMSPLFVMPDTNLFVEFDEAFFPKISFFAQSDYVYKVIRRNLATGEEKTVHTVSDIQGEIMFNDKEVNGFGLIGYRIEIENKYSIIGHSKEKFIFFNELLPVIKNGKR